MIVTMPLQEIRASKAFPALLQVGYQYQIFMWNENGQREGVRTSQTKRFPRVWLAMCL